ncbi:hypothetical protein [Clostridium beijerinckii]|uniref:Uncharacterized protein n=1 Tax=Clostridium beijerinckii TaxID=1520 RepID=A0AAW3WG68_CLOBE|nr:hypothetical protein [Clostridium beijerinckii]MBC2460398.1 hypothetical protein [Clostridium beijerinckii]MBC2477875.1 hypothetical protein [Clostridium beijerinckii]NOV63572.1 hypothetical protein [Clostridium beijerinckii]NOV73429.1 hypothetical protein [Clostridium beijerinckii]NOW35456.1 hypothetical protein [Clostridium beijerinckii]
MDNENTRNIKRLKEIEAIPENEKTLDDIIEAAKIEANLRNSGIDKNESEEFKLNL